MVRQISCFNYLSFCESFLIFLIKDVKDICIKAYVDFQFLLLIVQGEILVVF